MAFVKNIKFGLILQPPKDFYDEMHRPLHFSNEKDRQDANNEEEEEDFTTANANDIQQDLFNF